MKIYSKQKGKEKKTKSIQQYPNKTKFRYIQNKTKQNKKGK